MAAIKGREALNVEWDESGSEKRGSADMKLLNAVVHKNSDDLIEIWGDHQIPSIYQLFASKISGIKPDKIKMIVMTKT